MAKSSKEIQNSKSPLWFYLILISIPLLFFVLLETGLRIFDYGRNDKQWIKVTDTKQMLNPDIAGRYFYNTKDLPQSNNDAFDIVKRENSFRIFVMGGSSAQGFPFSPNGTFSRYIRDRLELLFPEKHIEVINIAITATNSYTIRDLITGVIDQKPDLILIYAGHNEYYGAFGVGSTENIGNSREFVNFLIWLNKFKSVKFLRNVMSSVGKWFSVESETDIQRGGTLMARIVKEQLISYNSESYEVGLSQFKGNLNDILKMTNDINIPVIIGTLVSNLKGQKPFVSIDDNETENADSIYSQAKLRLSQQKFTYADSLFRLAKDLDALRFRAPEEINSIIKRLGSKYNAEIVNIDSMFNSSSTGGIVGNNLIVDHLHPSLDGYLLMGKIYFEAMEVHDLLPEREKTVLTKAQQDRIVINNFAFSKLDSTIAKIRLEGLLNDWPFVESPDFSFLKNLDLQDRIDSLAYKVAVENMNWEKAHYEAADFYLSNKDYRNFSKEMKVIISQYPFKLKDYDYAASQLINAKEYEIAYEFLTKRYRELPDAFTTKWLGNISLNEGETDSAIRYFLESTKYYKDAQVFYNLAGAYIQREEYSEALTAVEKCLSINPKFPNAENLEIQLRSIIAQ